MLEYYNNAPFQEYPDVMSTDQVQTALGIGRTSVYRLVKSGQLKSIRIGRVYKIPKRYLVDYVFGLCYDKEATRGLTVLKEAKV